MSLKYLDEVGLAENIAQEKLYIEGIRAALDAAKQDVIQVTNLGSATADKVGEESGGLARNDGRYAVDAEQMEYLPEEVGRASLQLAEYFSSSRSGFDINVRFTQGTDFQREVWQALCGIPFGATVSYEDIALKVTGGDKAKARKITRAVGAACGDNPVAVIVPCHRVIGKDGSIVGYSAGIDIKDYLLLHESFTAVTPLGFKEA